MSEGDELVNRPIKVLQVAPLGSGGVTSLILNIAGELDSNKVKFDYLTFFDRTEFNEQRAKSMGSKKFVVPIDHYKNPIIRSIFKFIYAIYIIKKADVDIIHIDGSKPYDVLVGVSAKLAGVKKVIFHSHNSSMDKTKGFKKVIMEIIKNFIPMIADYNLACSELAARFMFPQRTLREKKYELVKNAINVERYRFSEDTRVQYRKKLGIENKFTICHVGRFMPQKNHKGLIDIFEMIVRKNPDSILLLIGEGVLFEEIKEYVAEKGLQGFVKFLGTTQEVPEILQASDCFLLPSFYEGLPVVGVEVQASGLPIVMSDTITQEVKLTEQADYLSLEASVKEWADAVLKYNTTKYNRVICADIVADAGFHIREVAERMTVLYENLLQ